jgi:hypothetical protein
MNKLLLILPLLTSIWLAAQSRPDINSQTSGNLPPSRIAPVAAGSVLVSGPLSAFQIKPMVDVRDYGTFGDGTTGHAITDANIASNKQWLGCGTVNTSGTAVTWVSGAKFYPTLVNSAGVTYQININGSDYTVSAIGAVTSGVATSMTLTRSAGTHSGLRWCMYAAGDQWDYVGLQEAIFTALGAPGAEHGLHNSRQNREIMIPAGSYFVNKTLNITSGVGVNLSAAQHFAVTITTTKNETPVLTTNGFSNSTVRGIFFSAGSANAVVYPLVDIDWDGSAPGNALQEDLFESNIFAAGSGSWANGLVLAKSEYMGSENTFISNRFEHFTTYCYAQWGYNALQNTFIGGDFSGCPGTALYNESGGIAIFGTGFQNNPQTGCDIKIDNSANSPNFVGGGTRTESVNCFVKTGGGTTMTMQGVHMTPGIYKWTANTPCANFNGVPVIPPTASTQGFTGPFRTTSSSGNTGRSEPTWTYSGATDGSCKWTYAPITFANFAGPASISDSNTIGGSVFTGSIYYPVHISNSYFSGQDFLNPHQPTPSTSSPNMVTLDNVMIWVGGGVSGGERAFWALGSDPQMSVRNWSPHLVGDQPQCWNSGGGGLSDSDVCLGVGKNPNNASSRIYPESILALIGPNKPSGSNPKFGRQDAFASNVTGIDQDFAGGRSTGSGAGGNINFWTSPAAVSGSTLNALVNRWQITPNGHLFTFTDNTYDIGATGNTRPRTGYFGTSVVTPLVSAKQVKLANGPFSSLPACASGTEGMLGAVNDSVTDTWGAAIAGNGSDHVLAYCDGTSWTVTGK